MTVQTTTKIKKEAALKDIFEELQDIKSQLVKFLALIPIESIKEYKNASQIKKDYFKAIKTFRP